MKRLLLILVLMCLASSLLAADVKTSKLVGTPTPGDQMLADYFRGETSDLAERCLADSKTLDEWKAKRE